MNGIVATRTVALLLVLVPACAPSSSDAGAPGDLPLLALTGPSLEIGVVEGDEAYTFAAIDGVLRLADGSIAVSDGDPAASRIVLYDESGTFLRAFGGRGEGPGEFRTLSRIYALGSDSLMAADNSTARLSVFGLDGGFARQLEGVELSRDSTFRLDSWMYGRFWIDGALRAADRTAVSAAIDRLPPPRSDPGYRSARVASDGGLWVREPDRAVWTRLDPDGDPVAAIRVPAWLQAAPAPVPAGGPTDDELDALMRESIIDLARDVRSGGPELPALAGACRTGSEARPQAHRRRGAAGARGGRSITCVRRGGRSGDQPVTPSR